MNLFNQIKEQVTARQVAEGYGLAVGRNGMACCPFHDDKHPSLKVDKGFYYFGCGEKGDAIAYAAIIISVEVLFFFVIVQKNMIIAYEEKKNKEAQINIMLSQIQPHFIYNSLSSISTFI